MILPTLQLNPTGAGWCLNVLITPFVVSPRSRREHRHRLEAPQSPTQSPTTGHGAASSPAPAPPSIKWTPARPPPRWTRHWLHFWPRTSECMVDQLDVSQLTSRGWEIFLSVPIAVSLKVSGNYHCIFW